MNNNNNIQVYKTFEIKKKIVLDKVFPKINNVNIQNLLIDEESLMYITPYTDANRITEIIVRHFSKYKTREDTTIIDCTGGVGGDTIAFCQVFDNVVSIELDQKRFEVLKHNVEEYKFKNVNIINGDSLLIVPKLAFIDIIYIDPPWGGRDYKLKETLKLEFGSQSIEQFILNCFNKELFISCPKIVVLK